MEVPIAMFLLFLQGVASFVPGTTNRQSDLPAQTRWEVDNQKSGESSVPPRNKQSISLNKGRRTNGMNAPLKPKNPKRFADRFGKHSGFIDFGSDHAKTSFGKFSGIQRPNGFSWFDKPSPSQSSVSGPSGPSWFNRASQSGFPGSGDFSWFDKLSSSENAFPRFQQKKNHFFRNLPDSNVRWHDSIPEFRRVPNDDTMIYNTPTSYYNLEFPGHSAGWKTFPRHRYSRPLKDPNQNVHARTADSDC